MKKIIISALFMTAFTGCISLPSLTAEQERYATYVAEAICITSAVQGAEGLEQEKVRDLQSKYGTDDMQARFAEAHQDMTNGNMEVIMGELQNDPIQAGLFAKSVIDNIEQDCGLKNAGNVTQLLKQYIPDFPGL